MLITKEQEDIRKDFDRQFERIYEGFSVLERRIKASYNGLLLKLFGIVAGCITVGIAVARFLW